MFRSKSGKNKQKDNVRLPAGLTKQQYAQVKEVVDKARRDRSVPHTAQDIIPFQRMFPDGICRVTDNYYTNTIQFQDINYQLAQQEDQTAIFEEWCSFLNFFDSSIQFELSFMNMATDAADFEKMIRIPYKRDGFDSIRAEFSSMLKRQLSQGNNGLTKTKYLTFGITADNMRQAKPRLQHVEIDLLNNFRKIGVRAKTLNGKDRLRVMHAMFHIGEADNNKFHFDWKWLVKTGLSVKDFIAPTAFAFPKSRVFQMGSMYGTMSYLQITASDLSDQMLKDFLEMESSQVVTMHIQSVDQNKAIKTIKHTITELDRSKIEEQKKAVRSGYDMDIIPSDLATYGNDAKALLKELQSQNERMFLLTMLVMNTGKTEAERQGIGTPATRAGIIEKLIQKGYVERSGGKKGKFLIATAKGNALITIMPEQIQSASMTADWEQRLLEIERGEYSPAAFIGSICAMIQDLINTSKIVEGAEIIMAERKIIGTCPCCGAEVVERQKGWLCANRSCRFILWKDNAFFQKIGKRLSTSIVEHLLLDGHIRLKDCKNKATGKVYNATLHMVTEADGRPVFNLSFENGGNKHDGPNE